MSSAITLDPAKTSDVSSSPFVAQFSRDAVTANYVLKQNIDALLKQRGATRKDLAFVCKRTESWISKIFRAPDKALPMQYYDRIADFLGVSVYELFRPGTSTMT